MLNHFVNEALSYPGITETVSYPKPSSGVDFINGHKFLSPWQSSWCRNWPTESYQTQSFWDMSLHAVNMFIYLRENLHVTRQCTLSWHSNCWSMHGLLLLWRLIGWASYQTAHSVWLMISAVMHSGKGKLLVLSVNLLRFGVGLLSLQIKKEKLTVYKIFLSTRLFCLVPFSCTQPYHSYRM